MSLVGRQIGRYKILEQLGQGGMSIVYKGLDTALDREVAVKVLHPHLATKPESRKRLEREAKAVARLHHPNILEVFDFAGAESPEAYIVTEYIRGKTLRQFIADESMQPPEIAAMVMHEICSALAHAHEAGVLHRDLKPENVMLREDGVVKLTDFGIAKLLDRDEKMTVTGALVGSPAHMAPEIIEGEDSGAEADVFSLGTMLYLFATGKLPFTATNTTATLKRILDCVYDDPRQVVAAVSDELAEIIATCLQRDPALRYPNAGKMRDALAAMLNELGLTRPHEELPRFFQDPKQYRKELLPRVTGALLERAEKLIAEKRSAKAMSALNQVLAHDSSNARASALMAQMKARTYRDQRQKKLTRVAAISTVVLAVTLLGTRGYSVATRAPDLKVPLQFGPEEIVLSNVQWPKAPSPPPADEEGKPPESALETGLKTPPQIPIKTPLKGLPEGKRVATVSTDAKAIPLSKVTVNLRPWGHLLVDGKPAGTEEGMVHNLELPSGGHRLTALCDACVSSGVTQGINVTGDTVVNIAIPLQPSLVQFVGFPPDSIISVGTETRTGSEAAGARPFQVISPPAGSSTIRHSIRYSVSLNGAVIEEGKVDTIVPGKAATITPRKP